VFFNESFIVDNTQILPYFLNLDLQNWVPFNWRSTMSGFHAVPLPLQIGIWSVGFCGGRKTEYQRIPWSNARTNNKRNPHMATGQN